MTVDKIMQEWKRKAFKPIYWLEGEEEYYINKLIDYAEHGIVPETEASFNLTIFYGRDADWAAVVNACRRYPMQAERQVVILKEAQQMRELDRLEGYMQKPLESTVLVVSYKDKKLDGRSKMAKLIKEKGELLTLKKMYDSQLPEWTEELVASKGYAISQKALLLLVEHVGNDLNRIDKEVDKLLINLHARKSITEDDIEAFVGVSKEYNVFELQSALAKKDLVKALRIIQYFGANPKAVPIQMLLPALYSFFSKVYLLFGQEGAAEKELASRIGVNPYFMQEYMAAARTYGAEGIESALLLLHEYNLKSLGVHALATADDSLMKEMVVKMMW